MLVHIKQMSLQALGFDLSWGLSAAQTGSAPPAMASIPTPVVPLLTISRGGTWPMADQHFSIGALSMWFDWVVAGDVELHRLVASSLRGVSPRPPLPYTVLYRGAITDALIGPFS